VGPTYQHHLLPLILSHSAASVTVNGELQPSRGRAWPCARTEPLASCATRTAATAGELRLARGCHCGPLRVDLRRPHRVPQPAAVPPSSGRRTCSSPELLPAISHARTGPSPSSSPSGPTSPPIELLPPTCPRRKKRRSPLRPQAPSHRSAGPRRRTCESGSRRLACVAIASVLGWMLKKGLTCGAHMSSSGRRTIRNMCVQIWSDSGPIAWMA
jgi:hypothetical protein